MLGNVGGGGGGGGLVAEWQVPDPESGEGAAARRQELPGVAARMQGELQNAEGRVIADGAGALVAGHRRWVAVAEAPVRDDELPDAVGVGLAERVLGHEALIVVVAVRVEDDVGVRVVEIGPERGAVGPVAQGPRVPSRDVPVGQRADARVSGQVGLQPFLLVAPDPTTARALRRARDGRALGIERDDVPVAEVVAVVSVGPEVGDVGPGGVLDPREDPGAREVLLEARVVRRPRVPVVTVADGWIDDRVGPPERRVIHLVVLGEGAVVAAVCGPILVVAERQERRRQRTGDEIRDRLLQAVVLRIQRGRRPVAEIEVRIRRRARQIACRLHHGIVGERRGGQRGHAQPAGDQRQDQAQTSHSDHRHSPAPPQEATDRHDGGRDEQEHHGPRLSRSQARVA